MKKKIRFPKLKKCFPKEVHLEYVNNLMAAIAYC